MATTPTTSFMDQAKALTDANKVTPETQAFDESQSSAARTAAITSSGSPLMKVAATRGAQMAAKRGLTNSSLGIESAEKAVIDAPPPRATTDASLSSQQALANQSAKNQAGITNANLAVSAGQTGMQLGESGRQFDTSQDTQKDQFGKQLAQQQSQFDASQ